MHLHYARIATSVRSIILKYAAEEAAGRKRELKLRRTIETGAWRVLWGAPSTAG
jgi:hypothetical protein